MSNDEEHEIRLPNDEKHDEEHETNDGEHETNDGEHETNDGKHETNDGQLHEKHAKKQSNERYV